MPKLLLAIGLYCSLSVSLVVQAQNACVSPRFKGDFNIDKVKVCVGSPVNIIDVPPTLSSAGYTFLYDGQSSIDKVVLTSAQSWVYTQPGSYTILQAGSGNGSGAGTILCREITVLPLEPVIFAVKACSGRTALLDATLDAKTGQYDSYVINWGDGQNSPALTRTQIVTQQSHTYANNGPYTIRITGRYDAPASCETPFAATQTVSKTITLSAAAGQPSITKLATTSDNSISVDYQAGNGVAIELFQKDASGIYAPTGQKGTSAGTFNVQTNAKQVQCFQVVAQDACNTSGQRSDEVCSLILDAKATNKINDLTWVPYAGTVSAMTQFRRYRITRNGTRLIDLFDRNIGNHRDLNKIECGTPYCYTLEATIAGTVETVITSAPVCVTGINGDLPGSFGNTIVSIEDGQPRLVASLPVTGTTSSYTLAISRADGPSGSFQPVGTVSNKNTFTDATADPSASQYCYQLTYLANCGLSSPPSTPVCTVLLGSQSSGSIDWTAASPFAPGSVASYTVEVIDSLNGTRSEIQLGGNLRYEPNVSNTDVQSQKYRVIAVSNTGQVSYSNFFTLRREATILVPSAFTPNGDGTNDEFAAKGIFVDRFSMTIYDRWGSVVYATSDKARGWDGTADGQSLAAGQYMYRIEVQDSTGLKTVRTGSVLLIR